MMFKKGFKRIFKPLKLLSEEDVNAIHAVTLDILRNTGIKFVSKWALNFLKKHDCIVNDEDQIVKFPEGLVEECIRKTPSSFRFKARAEKDDVIFCKDVVYFQEAPGMHILDLETFKPRPPTKQEYIDYVKVLDYLPNCHLTSPYPYFGYEEVPAIMLMPELMALKFKYSSMLGLSPYQSDAEIFIIQMAQTVSTEICGVISQAPPLTWFDNAIMQARRCIEAGFPVGPCSGTTFGATGPVTLAGTVAKTNAELISMLVLVQLLKPGHRTLMLLFEVPQNMRTGAPAFGQIGSTMANALYNQMWRWYNIPLEACSPGFINAKTPDFQSGYEKAINGIISAVSGANIVQFHGCIMGELSAHPVQAVMDDDIAGMIGRFIEGVDVNEETLALDLIHEVGQSPGHYLGKPHTAKWWKLEQFIPKVADRTATYDDWLKKGKKSSIDLAKEKTKEIIQTHNPIPLNDKQEEDIQRILEDARQYYKKRGML